MMTEKIDAGPAEELTKKVIFKRINIDCAPGSIRPDNILCRAIKETSLLETDFTEVSRCFGNWTWTIPMDKYMPHQKAIGEKLKAFYEMGAIRYAAW